MCEVAHSGDSFSEKLMDTCWNVGCSLYGCSRICHSLQCPLAEYIAITLLSDIYIYISMATVREVYRCLMMKLPTTLRKNIRVLMCIHRDAGGRLEFDCSKSLTAGLHADHHRRKTAGKCLFKPPSEQDPFSFSPKKLDKVNDFYFPPIYRCFGFICELSAGRTTGTLRIRVLLLPNKVCTYILAFVKVPLRKSAAGSICTDSATVSRVGRFSVALDKSAFISTARGIDCTIHVHYYGYSEGLMQRDRIYEERYCINAAKDVSSL